MLNDRQIWDRFLEGNDDIFEEIYKNHINILFAYALKFTTDRELAKDCIHDLFTSIYQNRINLGSTDNIKAYLFKALKRSLFRALQKQKHDISDTTDSLSFLSQYSDAEDDLDLNDLTKLKLKKLEKAMYNLSSRQKEAIYLRYVQEMDYDNICQIMEVNYQSARNLIHRSIEKLREFINGTNHP